MDAPTELDEGQTPSLTVHCGKLATGVGTGVFFRVYDVTPGSIPYKVCETGVIFPSAGDFSHTILKNRWTKTMPGQAWYLKIEALIWWL